MLNALGHLKSVFESEEPREFFMEMGEGTTIEFTGRITAYSFTFAPAAISVEASFMFCDTASVHHGGAPERPAVGQSLGPQELLDALNRKTKAGYGNSSPRHGAVLFCLQEGVILFAMQVINVSFTNPATPMDVTEVDGLRTFHAPAIEPPAAEMEGVLVENATALWVHGLSIQQILDMLHRKLWEG